MIAVLATAKGALVIGSEKSEEQFRVLTQMIDRILAESSRRVYANTYRQWSAYTAQDGLDTLDLSFENISAFSNQSEVAYATRQSWKTHMLRLLDWLEEANANDEWYAKQRRRVLKFVKVKRMDAERGRRRSQRALSRTEVARLLVVWADDQRHVGIRNYALLRLLIYTGLRRAEVVMLRWDRYRPGGTYRDCPAWQGRQAADRCDCGYHRCHQACADRFAWGTRRAI